MRIKTYCCGIKSKQTPPHKLPTNSPALKTHTQFLYVSMANTLKIRSQLYYLSSIASYAVTENWELLTMSVSIPSAFMAMITK